MRKEIIAPLEMLIDEFVNALAEGDHYGGQYNDADNPFCQYFFHIYPPLQTVSSFVTRIVVGRSCSKGMPPLKTLDIF